MTDDKTTSTPVISVGKAIRIYREHVGLSIEQLGKKAGIAPRGISYIEKGLTPNPGVKTIKRILKALNCRLIIIYDGEKKS
jgi:transcriptional regulator with XRE-family HTH domain